MHLREFQAEELPTTMKEQTEFECGNSLDQAVMHPIKDRHRRWAHIASKVHVCQQGLGGVVPA